MKKVEMFDMDGFLYAGGFWYSPDGHELMAVNPRDENEEWTTAAFLHDGKVTRETFLGANKYKTTPENWTKNTLRTAMKFALREGILED